MCVRLQLLLPDGHPAEGGRAAARVPVLAAHLQGGARRRRSLSLSLRICELLALELADALVWLWPLERWRCRRSGRRMQRRRERECRPDLVVLVVVVVHAAEPVAAAGHVLCRARARADAAAVAYEREREPEPAPRRCIGERDRDRRRHSLSRARLAPVARRLLEPSPEAERISRVRHMRNLRRRSLFTVAFRSVCFCIATSVPLSVSLAPICVCVCVWCTELVRRLRCTGSVRLRLRLSTPAPAPAPAPELQLDAALLHSCLRKLYSRHSSRITSTVSRSLRERAPFSFFSHVAR